MNQYKQSCVYYRLPEEGPSGAKHMKGIGKLRIKISIRKAAFCWFILFKQT
jgi:hypothetical protein